MLELQLGFATCLLVTIAVMSIHAPNVMKQRVLLVVMFMNVRRVETYNHAKIVVMFTRVRYAVNHLVIIVTRLCIVKNVPSYLALNVLTSKNVLTATTRSVESAPMRGQ